MTIQDKTQAAKEKINAGVETARQSASDAYDATREKAVAAYDASRRNAAEARRKTGEGIEANPLLAIGGGVALGLILGAILPRSRREQDVLSGVGSTLNTRAHSAFDAAKSAGQRTLEERGLTTDAAESVVRDAVKGVGEAARNAGTAAARTAKTTD